MYERRSSLSGRRQCLDDLGVIAKTVFRNCPPIRLSVSHGSSWRVKASCEMGQISNPFLRCQRKLSCQKPIKPPSLPPSGCASTRNTNLLTYQGPTGCSPGCRPVPLPHWPNKKQSSEPLHGPHGGAVTSRKARTKATSCEDGGSGSF